MKYFEYNKTNNKEYEERLTVVAERLAEISAKPEVAAPFDAYFKKVADYLLTLKSVAEDVLADPLCMAGAKGKEMNKVLIFDDVAADAYETSFLNPTYAVETLGAEYGNLFSTLFSRIRYRVAEVYEGDIIELCLYAEVFVELYVMMQDEDSNAEMAIEAFSSFMHDNAEIMVPRRISRRFNENTDFKRSILMDSDLSTPDFMYRYGEPIGKNELEIFEFLKSLPEEELQAMADTYTEGFRKGFIATNKPLEKKNLCDVMYPIGFEPTIRLAVENFKKMGLRINAMPFSTPANKQYDFDHEKDDALYLDKSFVERYAEASKSAYEMYKEAALKYAGPAVVETFGETPFEPQNRDANLKYDKKKQELYVQLQGAQFQLYYQYIPGDERSFTIISYPVPEIGDKFKEIFAETVKVNTLDYELYQGIQQKIIDVLDTADYVHVLGSGENKTDIKVNIWKLQDPAKETAFENCVADVNIPVGEVFTSPVLEGTNGKLHVTQVDLMGRNFKNLEIDFVDGMITNYNCTNFEKEEDNKQFIMDNIMFNHDTLPIGEFAIGTNTTAYRMGIEYNIQAQLPILIAEKTGPHFAVGDTCYSHDEDTASYNADGKRIVARENSVSALRNTDPSKAYLNCHTDITIPYNELKSIVAVAKDGTETPIIIDGKFVIPGTEELNVPLEGLL